MKLTPLTFMVVLAFAAGTAAAQPTFPRIDAGTQAARDKDRGTILMQERDEETKSLQAAEKAFATGASGDKDKLALDVERHRKNLAALDAEIQRTGDTAPGALKVAGPVRLRAASAAPAAAVNDAPVPFWDVYRRKETQP